MMPKVYIPKKVRKKSRGGTRPGWGYLFTGLALGLGIGLVAYLYHTRVKQPVPVQATTETPAAKTPQKKQGAQKNQKASQEPAKSQFDFYTLLPEMEVVVPEPDDSAGSSQHPAKTEKDVGYILQTGSFRTFDEADGFKANLALIGVEAGIQTVTIDGENTWYRVRIGPYTDLNRLKQVRMRLKQNNIDYIVLKIKS